MAERTRLPGFLGNAFEQYHGLAFSALTGSFNEVGSLKCHSTHVAQPDTRRWALFLHRWRGVVQPAVHEAAPGQPGAPAGPGVQTARVRCVGSHLRHPPPLHSASGPLQPLRVLPALPACARMPGRQAGWRIPKAPAPCTVRMDAWMHGAPQEQAATAHHTTHTPRL